MTELITMSNKGQITIPIQIREKFGKNVKSKLFCSYENDMIIIKKTKKSLLDYEGFLGRTLPDEEETAAVGLAKHVLGEE